MTTLALPTGASLTVDDLEALGDDGHRYELYEGTLVVTPAPVPLHQLAAARLLRVLEDSAPHGLVVVPGPVDWRINRTTQFEPDIVVVTAELFHNSPKRFEKPPLLAIEILSPSTRAHDLGAKRIAYAAGGLLHYWIVDTARPSVAMLDLDPLAGEYVVAADATGDDIARASAPFAVPVRPSALVRATLE